jgi:hypothetical protein
MILESNPIGVEMFDPDMGYATEFIRMVGFGLGVNWWRGRYLVKIDGMMNHECIDCCRNFYDRSVSPMKRTNGTTVNHQVA